MKLTVEQVVKIRRQAAAGRSVRALAADVGVSPGAIQKIVTGLSYADVGGPITRAGERIHRKSQKGAANPNAVIRVDNAISIRSALATTPRSIIAARHGVDRSTIDKIASGHTWNDYFLLSQSDIPFPDEDLLTIDLADGRPPRDSEDEARLTERVFQAYRRFGYPHRRWSERSFNGYIERVATAPVLCEDGVIKGTSVGLKLLTAFHPHFDHVSTTAGASPADVFVDDELFRSAILGQIRFGRRLTPAGIRSALTEVGAQISAFRPAIARFIIERFGAQSVLDPCAGWGGRMVGAIAAGAHYFGIDPNIPTIAGNRGFLSLLRQSHPITTRVELREACAEDLLGSDEDIGKFDLVFTSPPYFDLERYSTDPTQSFARYPEIQTWLDEFLLIVIEGSARRLNACGRIVLNVSDALVDHVESTARRAGLAIVERLYIGYESRRWRRAAGKRVRSEPILVMKVE